MVTRVLALLSGLTVLAACGGTTDDEALTQNQDLASETLEQVVEEEAVPATLRDLLEADERFSTLVAALTASDLLVTLEEEGPLTILAPNNAAFDALPSALSIDVLTAEENKAVLRDLLAYHVLSTDVSSKDLQGRVVTINAVNGDPLTIDATGPVISIGDGVVVITDLQAVNGVVHVIDTVLLPPAN
ncbi:MAG: fasciclin domain-containing protein [Pseudomonadota bacterium]